MKTNSRKMVSIAMLLLLFWALFGCEKKEPLIDSHRSFDLTIGDEAPSYKLGFGEGLMDGENLVMESSDPSIVSIDVDKDGYVKAHKAGKVTLTIRSSKGQEVIDIKVTGLGSSK